MPKKVLIIKGGDWGALRQEKGDYDRFVKQLEEILGKAERPVLGPRGEDRGREKSGDIEVVSSTQEALEKARLLPMNDGPATLVFVTRGMLFEAERVKQEHPALKVVLFTGLFPEDRVIVISKQSHNIGDLIVDAVLHW